MMACFVPFNNRNLDISFFVFRPTVVFAEEVVEALKHFSLYTEGLGCIHSSIFRSIHGNLIIWYGAWMKKSNENKDILNAILLSMLENVATMAILTEHSYFEAYGGGSRDGSPAAKFSTGDTVSMNVTDLSTDQITEKDFSYACLAIFKSRFLKMEGALAGVCLKSQLRTRVVNLYIWKSLHACYSWILISDYRNTVLPYYDGLPIDVKYDVFKVVYVSGDNVLDFKLYPPRLMFQNEVQSTQGRDAAQDLERVE